ncbi:unnamed protein product [marine sediment metagenome]|uniref:Uncharacterized protein n=1 Tax=marine sediment metagenome TaxID=412755 RepID=X1LTI6_9ZZZZ
MGPDMKPPGQEWVLAWEGSLYTTYKGNKNILPTGFLKSSDNYLCPDSPGNKNTYYFTEVYLWQRGYGEKLTLLWSDGINCKGKWITGYNILYIYKSWFNMRWYSIGYLARVYNTGPSSWGRCWKSLTGEYPGYYPFPEKEIIRV